MVGEHAVVLLGHPPVERAQPGLEVGDRQVQLHRGEGAGQRRVGVAVDQHPVGALLVEHGVERGEHGAGLHAVAARADAEVDVRVRDAQVGEEDVGHARVVVLAGVHDDVLDVAAPAKAAATGASFTNCGRAPTMLRIFTASPYLRSAA